MPDPSVHTRTPPAGDLPVPPWQYRSPSGRVEADPFREMARLRTEWLATLDGMPLRLPNKLKGAVPIPGATRRPRPPWVPKPPPHLARTSRKRSGRPPTASHSTNGGPPPRPGRTCPMITRT